MRFKGRLFGPGIAPAGERVDAIIDAIQLALQPVDGRPRKVPLTQLGLRAAGYNDTQWELSWSEADTRHALLIEDPAVIDSLRRQPPLGLAAAIEAVTRKRRRAAGLRGLAVSAVGLWLLLPVLAIVALIAAAGPVSGWVIGHVPLAHEVKLGDWFFEAQARKLQLIKGTEANRVLEDLGARLTAGSRYTYRWHVARDPSLNAFAVPGGIVVVHSGLIQAADSAEELAGVLAHEIEHVEQRHSLKAMAQQLGLRAVLAAVIGDVGIAGQAAGQLAGLKFSRDNEREADRRGLARLEQAGISPAGMVTLFAKLGAQNPAGEATAWLSTHPASRERIDQLQAAIAATRGEPRAALPYDWGLVKGSIEP